MDIKEIYELHKNMVYNLAYQYVQNTEDAEEICQDVFVKVFQKIGDFKHNAELKTWIYRICINTSLDFIRFKKNRKRAFIISAFGTGTTIANTEPHDFHHPGVALEQKEAFATLFKNINKLPEQQKTALILLKIEQLNYQEVSAILNVSVKAVESLFQRAKKNLNNLLELSNNDTN